MSLIYFIRSSWLIDLGGDSSVSTSKCGVIIAWNQGDERVTLVIKL